MKKIIISLFCILAAISSFAAKPEIKSQWKGARVAFIGDSITDPSQMETYNDVYWNMMRGILGIEPYVYAVSGYRMQHSEELLNKLKEERGDDIDAIIIFLGTNDYTHACPLGEFYAYSEGTVVDRGNEVVTRKHRELVYDKGTFKGITNYILRYAKELYPDKQIVLMTSLHKGFYSRPKNGNIQPCEEWANANGEFLSQFVEAVKEAGSIWSVPVIDLYSTSTLNPTLDVHHKYFRGDGYPGLTDYLHPNTEGHRRLAYIISYQLLSYPAKLN